MTHPDPTGKSAGECKADFYALWCDECNAHPSNCKKKAGKSAGELADFRGMREKVGRAIYLAMYAKDGGRWEANETKEVWYEIADRFLALSQPAAREEESGWLIELGDSSPSRPDYWIGPSASPGWPFALWSNDHLKAVRFARKQDAEAVAGFMKADAPNDARANFRIAEHSWSGPAALSQPAAREEGE